jgi:hypothetical protein
LVEALIICHKVSHCICNMHHVLTHSYVFFKYITISHYPPSDTGGTNAYTKVTALELFLLHKEFSHCTLANMCHWQPHIFIVHGRYCNEEAHAPNIYSYKQTVCSQLRPVYKKKISREKITVIHSLMSFTVNTMLADLWFKLQVHTRVYVVNYICLSIQWNKWNKATEISKSLSMHGIKKQYEITAYVHLILNKQYANSGA